MQIQNLNRFLVEAFYFEKEVGFSYDFGPFLDAIAPLKLTIVAVLSFTDTFKKTLRESTGKKVSKL